MPGGIMFQREKKNKKKEIEIGSRKIFLKKCNIFDVFRLKYMANQKNLVRFMAEYVRNSELENLHSGLSPSSATGDFSDVKVVTPYGEIPWKEVSRISDPEMRVLMLSIEKQLLGMFKTLDALHSNFTEKEIYEMLKKKYEHGVTWDWKKK